MNEYIEKWVVEFKKISPNFGILEDIELFFTIMLWLIGLGIGIPIALWVARRVYKGVKKTKTTVGK